MSSVLGVPVNAMTDVVIIANRRMLLSGVSVSYIVTVSSDAATDYYIALLQKSVSNGIFATTLSAKCGFQITSASVLAVFNLSATTSTSGLVGSSQSGKATLIRIQTPIINKYANVVTGKQKMWETLLYP